MKSKINKVIAKIVLPRDYSSYFSTYILNQFKNDFLYNKNTTIKDKIW